MNATKSDFLHLLFNDDEYVCYASTLYDVTTYHRDSNVSDYSVFFTINPLRKDAKRADQNCIAFRTFLMELDEGTIAEQEQYATTHHIPSSAIVFSGGKSLHHLICLDESLSALEYRRYARWIHKALPKIDHKTKNPSRLSRLPFIIRPDTHQEQKLVFLGQRINVKQLREWLESLCKEPKEHMEIRVIKPSHPDLRGILRKATMRCIEGGWNYRDRNNMLFRAACNFAEENYSLDECVNQLTPNFPFQDIGAEDDFTKDEFMRTIHSAYGSVLEKIKATEDIKRELHK